jgi:hypothetical protein
VFSRPDCRWLPVDPIRTVVNKRQVFDPTPVGSTPRPAIVDNHMMYVLAIEEDGYMRDVTPSGIGPRSQRRKLAAVVVEGGGLKSSVR